MHAEALKKLVRRGRFVPHWLWEIVIVAMLIPPLLHAVSALDALPLV
jgi:hypothetical protein